MENDFSAFFTTTVLGLRAAHYVELTCSSLLVYEVCSAYMLKTFFPIYDYVFSL